MGSKKTHRPYVSKNLELIGRTLAGVKGVIKEGRKNYTNIDYLGLENAIKSLPRNDREIIEKFWGLTGGINHSKKLIFFPKKDEAFKRLSEQAVTSLRTLFRVDYMSMFDKEVKNMIEHLSTKINNKDMEISDLEAIKYLIVFLLVFQNGPKLSYETDLLAVDTDINPEFIIDEYATIKGAYEEFKDIPDGAINIRLVCDFLEMLDFKDTLAIKKSFCIKVPTSQIPEELRKEEIEPLYTLGKIRNLKERAFSYGPWEVTTELIMGNVDKKIDLEEFLKNLDRIRKNWSKIEEFKCGHKELRTTGEIRNLNVYNIGGLEFTDIYEVMFLYLERNVITP